MRNPMTRFGNPPPSTISPYERMANVMESMWKDWPQFGSLPATFREGFAPSIEVKDRKKEVFVRAEIPGLEQNDIQLTLSSDNDVLYLAGEKRIEDKEEDDDHNIVHSEITYGRFQRAIPLPSVVDAEKVKAKFRNGVLKITMEKAEGTPHGSRRIPIS